MRRARHPNSAIQSALAARVHGSSHLLRNPPRRSRLQPPSLPPQISRGELTSAAERQRKACPTTEQAGRAIIRLTPLTTYITTMVTGSAPQAVVTSVLAARHMRRNQSSQHSSAGPLPCIMNFAMRTRQPTAIEVVSDRRCHATLPHRNPGESHADAKIPWNTTDP